MKTKSIILIFLCFFYASPLLADYSKMNQALENYTPPEYYQDALEKKTDTRTLIQPDRLSGSVLSQIKDLKLELEKNTGRHIEISFLKDIDPVIFRRLAGIAFDQEAVSRVVKEKIKLNEIEILTGLRNPAVLAAQKKVKAGMESFNQVMDLDENLKQYSAFTQGLNNKIGPLKMKDSIKQKYPFPGLTSIKARIINNEVKALVEKMSIARKTVITETRKAYWNIVFIEGSIKITLETIEAFNRLNQVATTLYRSGKTSFQDIIKINIRIEVLKEDIVTLLSKKKNIEVKLCELLNLSSTTKLGKVVLQKNGSKILSPEQLYPIARQNRQELKVIRYNIEKLQNMIEMAESMMQEPFTLNFSINENEAINTIGTNAAKSSFPEKTMASMKNNTPLKPWYGIDDPWLNQTRQNLLSLKQTLVKEENATDRMVRETWFLADKSKRELALYKNRILPLSRSALDVSTREYEAGSIPFSQAINSYTYWLKVKLTIAKKQTELGSSVAGLKKIIGTSF